MFCFSFSVLVYISCFITWIMGLTVTSPIHPSSLAPRWLLFSRHHLILATAIQCSTVSSCKHKTVRQDETKSPLLRLCASVFCKKYNYKKDHVKRQKLTRNVARMTHDQVVYEWLGMSDNKILSEDRGAETILVVGEHLSCDCNFMFRGWSCVVLTQMLIISSHCAQHHC